MLRLASAGTPDRVRKSNPPVVMASGRVKWFDNKKGFGFISNETGADVFVHYSSIQTPGFKTLKEGEFVQFELLEGEKGLKAQNVHRAEPA
jgi:CspA family cold shock protein